MRLRKESQVTTKTAISLLQPTFKANNSWMAVIHMEWIAKTPTKGVAMVLSKAVWAWMGRLLPHLQWTTMETSTTNMGCQISLLLPSQVLALHNKTMLGQACMVTHLHILMGCTECSPKATWTHLRLGCSTRCHRTKACLTWITCTIRDMARWTPRHPNSLNWTPIKARMLHPPQPEPPIKDSNHPTALVLTRIVRSRIRCRTHPLARTLQPFSPTCLRTKTSITISNNSLTTISHSTRQLQKTNLAVCLSNSSSSSSSSNPHLLTASSTMDNRTLLAEHLEYPQQWAACPCRIPQDSTKMPCIRTSKIQTVWMPPKVRTMVCQICTSQSTPRPMQTSSRLTLILQTTRRLTNSSSNSIHRCPCRGSPCKGRTWARWEQWASSSRTWVGSHLRCSLDRCNQGRCRMAISSTQSILAPLAMWMASTRTAMGRVFLHSSRWGRPWQWVRTE